MLESKPATVLIPVHFRQLRRVLQSVAFATIIMISAAPGADAQALFPNRFEWPEVDPRAIPDARLRDVITTARQEARQASEYAQAGERAAGQARRLTALRSTIGRGPQPQTVGDGVVMSAVPYGDAGGAMFGEMAWASGARLTGIVSSGSGEYSPAIGSPLLRFTGWVWGVINPIPIPMTGVFEFKNGETFTGSYNAGSNASGIYVSADRGHRFIGELDFEAGSYRPMRGQLEDRRGRLLAVVHDGMASAPHGLQGSAVNPNLQRIFRRDMLGTRAAYLERIVGPARNVSEDLHVYVVEGCELSARVRDGVVVSLGVVRISPMCNVSLAEFGLSDTHLSRLTFGTFESISIDTRFTADCLSLCGNAADPSVYATVSTPHVNGFVEFRLGTELVDDDATSASRLWASAMTRASGPDFVSNTEFNCDRRFDSIAQQLFSNVKITSIEIGNFDDPSAC